MVNRTSASNISLALKTVGTVCIISFFIDFVILMLDFSIDNKQVQINLATALVDRGIVPLIGIVLILTGYWADRVNSADDRIHGTDLRFPVCVLSIILGAMFLLIFPLHIASTMAVKAQSLEQISQSAQRAEAQLNSQLNQVEAQLNGNDKAKAQLQQLKDREKAQVTALISDDKKFAEFLADKQHSAEEKELLKKFKAHPQELDKFIDEKSDPKKAADQKLIEIRKRREEAETQAQQSALRSGLRISITSLLYAIAYGIIGATGLQNIGSTQGIKRKSAVH
jgi:hypothetical protein